MAFWGHDSRGLLRQVCTAMERGRGLGIARCVLEVRLRLRSGDGMSMCGFVMMGREGTCCYDPWEEMRCHDERKHVITEEYQYGQTDRQMGILRRIVEGGNVLYGRRYDETGQTIARRLGFMIFFGGRHS